MKILQKLKECYISFYKKFFLKTADKDAKKGGYYKSSTTKCSMNSGATLKLSTKTEQIKSEITHELEILLKEYINKPAELIKYMRKQGMLIYKFKNADKFLLNINEQEGFLTPLKGKKALILNFYLGLKENKLNIDFSTKEMFIFSEKETEIYTLARALYKYYGFKRNMAGFDYKAQEKYKKVYRKNPDDKLLFSGFSLKDLFACKEAMARDIESINFAIRLSEKYAGSKNVLNKIKNDNSAKI